MPRDTYWSVAILLAWLLVVTVRLMLLAAERFSFHPVSRDAYRISGWIERLLILCSASFLLWSSYSGILFKVSMASALARETSGEKIGLYYSAAVAMALGVYWFFAAVMNAPGVPVALNRSLFWPFQCLLVIFVPLIFERDHHPIMMSVLPLTALWWITIRDQSYATELENA